MQDVEEDVASFGLVMQRLIADGVVFAYRRDRFAGAIGLDGFPSGRLAQCVDGFRLRCPLFGEKDRLTDGVEFGAIAFECTFSASERFRDFAQWNPQENVEMS